MRADPSFDDGDLSTAMTELRRVVSGARPRAAVFDVTTLRKQVDDGSRSERQSVILFGGFALLGLVLAATGLAGIVSFSIHTRVREIGVRMALGADAARTVRLVAGRALVVCVVGTVAGLALALPASRLLGTQLYQLAPTDPATWAAGAGVLLLAGAIAALVPARRAVDIDPAEALRSE